MKLIDLLVQELPTRGGWPDGAIYICTEKDGTPRIVGPCWHDNKSLSSFKINDDKSIIYSDQYESALAESQKPAWNGEGLPPVGCECESKQFSQVDWTKFKVVAVCDGHVFGFWGNGVPTALDSKMWQFRPLRTEADRKRDAAIEAIDWFMPECIPDTPNEFYHAKKIYDAIAAGKIPGVKLDD
nr:MAG TPA: hypothetical protein [Caudoviricetes sp.]